MNIKDFWRVVPLLTLLLITPADGQELPLKNIFPGREKVVSDGGMSFSFAYGASALRSFCCIATSDTTAAQLSTPSIVLPPQPIAGTFRGGSEPFVTFQSNVVNEGRMCFETPSNGLFGITVSARESDNATLENLRLRCDETSLYGGYNVAAADLNFLELVNITSTDVNVTVRLSNSRTGEKDRLFRQITLGPSQRADFDIHSNVESASFGAMRVTHDGPLNSITASVSQYKITNTDPLNFELIGRIPFTTRE